MDFQMIMILVDLQPLLMHVPLFFTLKKMAPLLIQ